MTAYACVNSQSLRRTSEGLDLINGVSFCSLPPSSKKTGGMVAAAGPFMRLLSVMVVNKMELRGDGRL